MLFLREPIRRSSDILFDKRVYNKWSFEELPLVQRIMNTVEKTATGVTPVEKTAYTQQFITID